MTTIRCDALVVGTGIIGAACALALADHGLDVIATGEPATTLGTASSAAGAMLGVLGEVTTDDDPAPGSLDDHALHLRHQAAQSWPDWAERIAEAADTPVPIHYGTTVIASAANPGDRANLRAISAAAEHLGLPAHPADPADLPFLAPAPRHETTTALWLPDEGHVDTTVLLPALHTALTAHPRVRHLPHAARHVRHSETRATGATLDDDTTVHCEHVILAAGCATQALLDDVGHAHHGVVPRLLPGKGTSYVFDAPGHALEHQVIRTPNREFACGLHLIGHADGTLYLGATNRIADTPGSHQQLPSGGELNLIDSAIHDITTRLRTAPIRHTRYGMRPLSTDGHLLIGATHLAGLHLATGTYRNGILLAPAIADMLATELTTGTAPADRTFSPVAPWRSRTPDVAAVIKRGIPHLVSFLLEPHGRMPYDRRTQLETALGNLFTLAFTDDHAAKELGERCMTILGSAHIPEVIPQAWYALAEAR
ncbi:NAD(P)/FAD-dependent oxidoreductase [Streptomyces klenkii]|uniref:NAD(P)/FAD-dependent oxidoreductase n=1 Tax=Streptomyces klenkii TaxID=1420899 RepID=UPI00343C9297